MKPMQSFSTAADKKSQGGWLWAVLLSLLALFLVAGAFNTRNDYQNALDHEYQLLEVQAGHREARISGALESVNLMLGSLIDDFREKPGASADEKSRLLKDALRHLPQLRSLNVTDASGRVVASNNEQLLGFDASGREYFKAHQATPLTQDFHVSLPFKAVTGVFATTVSRVMLDQRRQFAGVVVATLESGFFSAALEFQGAPPDSQALLINLNGDILNAVPKSALVSKSLIGSPAFTEHVASAHTRTRHLDVSTFESVKQVSVFQNLPKARLAVFVSRNYDKALADWRTSFYFHLSAFALLTGITVLLAMYASRRQRELINREHFIKTVTDAMPGMVAFWDRDMRCRFANQGYLEWFGKPAQALLGKTMQELMGETLFALNEPFIRGGLAGEAQRFERALTKADGSIGHTLTHYIPDIHADGEVVGLFVLVTDVTPLKQAQLALGERNVALVQEIDARKQVEQALRDKQILVSSVLDSLSEHVAVIDAEGTITAVNARWRQFARENGTTTPHRLAVGANYLDACVRAIGSSDGADAPQLIEGIKAVLTGKQTEFSLEYAFHSATEERWFILQCLPLSGSGTSAVLIHYDVSERHKTESILRASEKRLQEIAIRDPLTGLYNRRYLDEILPREMARATREALPVALIVLDLDHFKQVNDTYGHPAGDEVLKKLADALRSGARESDMICRYGGEEFVMALPGMSAAQALQRMESWRAEFAQTPLLYHGATIRVTLSAGIAAFPEHGSDIDTVVSCADKALYWAKNHGRNRVVVASEVKPE